MKSKAKQELVESRIIELPHHSYQPSIAELNEDIMEWLFS